MIYHNIKIVLVLCAIIFCNNCFIYSQRSPRVPMLEIFLFVEGNEGDTTTFYTKGQSVIYDVETMLPTRSYWDGEISIAGNYSDYSYGWEIKQPDSGADSGYFDTLGIGLYKFYTSEVNGPHFYYNLCDCRYFSDNDDDYGNSYDLDITYNGTNKTFVYKRSNDSGSNNLLNSGDTLNVWTALDIDGPPTEDCFLDTFTPSNISLSYVNNHPKLSWTTSYPDTIGAYKIYRTIWENDNYSGVSIVWPPVLTVDSWIDYDFDRSKFGVFQVDYQISYLTLPPQEFNLSDTVSTSNGDWDGPVGKIIINNSDQNDYNIILRPNPFNNRISFEFQRITSRSTLEIFDISGRRVYNKIINQTNSNDVVIHWRPNANISSGLFFVKIANNENSDVKKIMYLK